MPSYRPINAVVRAIDLLFVLNRQPLCTVDHLHKHTRIPKPTIVRLLETLAHRGLVQRGSRHGSYQVTAAVNSLSSGYHSEAKIVEAAGPIAVRLTKEIKWPVAVATLDRDAMVIQYSTIPYSPLAPYHSVVNRRYSMMKNALGRAYLAYCSPTERRIIVDLIVGNGGDDARIASRPGSVDRLVAETRARGYAMRHPGWQPESNSIAVPLYDGDSLAASMSVTWFRKALTGTEAARRYSSLLKAAAKEISARCGV
jgi:IclR family transcriptional regulator, mhp operon transcriptional activator